MTNTNQSCDLDFLRFKIAFKIWGVFPNFGPLHYFSENTDIRMSVFSTEFRGGLGASAFQSPLTNPWIIVAAEWIWGRPYFRDFRGGLGAAFDIQHRP